jgi:phosphoenolpyruvate carboxykinase (GTP)
MFQPFSNLDFISIPLGQYIENHLKLGHRVRKPPHIFAVNYFLQDAEGRYLTGKDAKRVWLQWMDLRIHTEIEAIRTPTGFIPHYGDLRKLFRKVLRKDYSKEAYTEQFTTRVRMLLEKLERIEGIYRETVPEAPAALYRILDEQRTRLKDSQEQYGDNIPPESFLR